MKVPQQVPEIAGHTYIKLISNKGGFGDVFLYEEVALHRSVAVKVIRDRTLDPAARVRFENEARTMAALEHPNVVRIYATGRSTDGRPYISMMHCPKPTLAQRAASGQLPLMEALEIGIAIGGAIESAHRAGVLHRDIKPANILTMPWGAPGLTDFGVAASLSLDAADDDAGVSIPWSPPEMLFTTTRGSPASDVYSLAATIWHILVGRSPFEVPRGDNSRMTLMSRIRDVPAPVTGRADVPSSLDRTLQRALAKNPSMRPQSVVEFARSLQAVQQELRQAVTPFVVLESTTAREPERAHRLDENVERTAKRSVERPALSSGSSSGIRRLPVAGSSSSDRLGSRSGSSDGRPSGSSSRADDLEHLVDGTVARPVVSQPPSPGAQGTGSLWPLALGALVIAALALGIGYLIFGGQEGQGRSTPQTTSTSAARDPGSGLSAIPPGELSVKGKQLSDTRVRFTWTYEAALASDRYQWRTAHNDGITDVRGITLNVKKGEKVCIQVRVVRDSLQGSSQAFTPRVCVTP